MQTIAKKLGIGVLTSQDVRGRRQMSDVSFIYVSLAVILAAVVIASAVLWSRLMVVNIGYGISKANTARAALIEQNKRLRVELMQLNSPERIERIASTELLLARPTGEQVISVK